MSRPRAQRSTLGGLPLLILAVATACSPAGGGPTATPAASPPTPAVIPVPGGISAISKEALRGVTIDVWHPWLGVEASLFESLVADFNETNEWGISVRSTGQSGYAELYASVTTSLPTSDHPQLVVALPEQALAWDAGGYVVDLTDYVDDPKYGLGPDVVGDFPKVFWSQDEIQAKRLGVPAERTARLLIYDSTWAHQLGFEAAPRSASELRQQACRAHQSLSTDQAKENDAEGGWLVDTSPMTFLAWTQAFGGGVVEGSSYRFLTPKNLEALTFIKQLYDDSCSWALSAAQDAPTAFAARTALFSTAGLEELPEYARAMAAANNADAWTVSSFPGAGTAGFIVYGSDYVLLKSTPDQQLASWLFVQWLLSPQNQAKWVEATGLYPLRTSVVALLKDYGKSHPQWSAALALLPLAQTPPPLASWREVKVMMWDGFDAMYRSNTPAGRVAEILAIMEKTASEISK